MIHATMMGDFDNGLIDERRKVLCPGCKSDYMSEGAGLCAKCRGKERGAARSECWLELHESEMMERHRLFKAALEAGYTISELVGMRTNLPVEGEHYCKLKTGRELVRAWWRNYDKSDDSG